MAPRSNRLFAALLTAVLASCGGAGGTGPSQTSSGACYASWTCSGPQCATVMGGYNGTAGPFTDDAACEQWRQNTILSSTCSCGTGGGGGGGGGGSTLAIANLSASSGTPGTTVTVTGTGFPTGSTGVTVSLCGTSATVTSVSSTQVVFTVPSMNASACAIQLGTPSGTVTSSGTFQVLPVPITVAAGASAWGIAVDATSVYWTEASGTVKKAPLAGGSPTTLASGLTNPQALAIDSAYVYFADYSVSGSLSKVPLGGGPPTTLASGVFQVSAIAVDATNVYWVEYNQPGSLKKVPRAGGAPTTIVTNLSAPVGVAVDASAVYWTESSGWLKTQPLAGGNVRGLTQTASAGLLALDATSVYFPTADGVAKTPKTPTGVVTTLASGQPRSPWGIAVDGSNVYWVEQSTMGSISDGAVKKVSVGGGTVTTLASGLSFPKCIVVDGSFAYWTENGGASPRKIAK